MIHAHHGHKKIDMGHWSVYCAASRLRVHNAVLLPIRRQIDSTNFSEWVPATLPIFGEYDTYGRLEWVEKNENTALIEDYFGVSIEKFLENFWEKNTIEEIKDWEYIWFRRDIYEYLSSRPIGEMAPYRLRGVNYGESFRI